MRKEMKSLLLVCTALAALALSACNALADTSNLNQTLDPELTEFTFEAGKNALEEDAVGIIDRVAKTVSVTVPFDTERKGLIPSIKHTGKSIAPEGEVAADFTKTVGYTIQLRNGGGVLYRVTVVLDAPDYTMFIYNETAYSPVEDQSLRSKSGASLADFGKVASGTPYADSSYDSSQDETVSMGDFQTWAADSMTADGRLALLCAINGSFDINGEEYSKTYIYKIIWGHDVDGATVLGDNFLAKFKGLASLDLALFSTLTSIGTNFLAECSSLTSLDLTPLSNIAGINERFLGSCSSLVSLNLPPMPQITHIDSSFLENCSSLVSLDLTELSNLTEIGEYFLAGCSGLVSLSLPPLSKITGIGAEFLNSCSHLGTLDLSDLTKISEIGNTFLYGCSRLKSLDLSALPDTVKIGGKFLQDCEGLSSIDMGNIGISSFSEPTGCFKLSDDLQECTAKVKGLTGEWSHSFPHKNDGLTFVNNW
ncbi:MAG: leucine-rich repeat domain-containing protein [Spirochaetaceae bacterium]|jgi:hypothetical protein|nr:leucine-rich repeat domain-containing protein [Spirochaetaceae bacterium]